MPSGSPPKSSMLCGPRKFTSRRLSCVQRSSAGGNGAGCAAAPAAAAAALAAAVGPAKPRLQCCIAGRQPNSAPRSLPMTGCRTSAIFSEVRPRSSRACDSVRLLMVEPASSPRVSFLSRGAATAAMRMRCTVASMWAC